MTELVERTIPTSVRIRMAHAAVQALNEQGVDLLHIKGVALDPRLAFPGRSSADADVLCRPAHVERLLLALRGSGWSLLNTFPESSAFEHSATLHHPAWGWLDLHRQYPGLGREPAAAFDALWATHGITTIAGVSCAVPAPPDQAVLLLLHAARSPGEPKARADVAHVWSRATPESREAILSSVDRLGAGLAFAVILGTLDEHRDDPEYSLWRIASAGGTRLDEWRARVVPPEAWGRRRALSRGRSSSTTSTWRSPDARRVRGTSSRSSSPAPSVASRSSTPSSAGVVGAGDGLMAEGYMVPDDVAVVTEDDAVDVALLPRGPIVALDGSAAEIWRAVTDTAPETDWLTRLATHFAVTVDEIGADTGAFLADLTARGLLAAQRT